MSQRQEILTSLLTSRFGSGKHYPNLIEATDLAKSGLTDEVANTYKRLGGILEKIPLTFGKWDICLNDFIVELDEEQHFNRYRAQTTVTKLNQVEMMKKFIGTWTLIKCVAIQKDGKITFPFGEKPIGQILYDIKGNMMVEIMNQEIKKFNNENPFQGLPEEIIPAYNGFLAYYGTYKILADSNLIIHTIKACSFPNWIGQNQERHFEFKNNKLILKTPSISSVQYELTWEKN